MTPMPTPKTVEERREISRRNGRKSKGPKTDEGKKQSRMNAFRHGMRAETVPMPNEDPDLAAARGAAWNDYYQPDSPGAQHLVNECARATLVSDRCQRAHDAALADQIGAAGKRWDEERADRVANSWAQLRDDPAEAIAGLET